MIPFINYDDKDKRGREPFFKCQKCGKFVSYDRRTYEIFYSYRLGLHEPLEPAGVIHKKCKKGTK